MRRLPFVDQVAQEGLGGGRGGKAVPFVTFLLCMFFFPVLGLLCTRGRIHYAEPCHFCQVCSSYLDVLECPEYSAGKSLCLFQIVSVMLTQTTVVPITREFYLCPKAKICLEHPCFFLASCILLALSVLAMSTSQAWHRRSCTNIE